MYLRYSSKVVAPMHWISPRDSAGLSTLDASIAPSAPPAPTSVCSSSMNRITFLARRTSFMTALMRSSNWPRYFVPATIIARSSTTIRFSCRISGTSCDDLLRQALDDRGLAHAGLAQQHRVVLGAAAEDLMTRSISRSRPMTGSSLPSLGQFGQVAAEAVERRRLGSCRPCRRADAATAAGAGRAFFALDAGAEQVEDLLADLFELEAQVHQHLGGDAVLLAQQAEQQVLGADVVVVEVAGLFDRVLDDLLGPRRLGQLAHRDHLGAALDELLDLEADLAQVHAEVLEHVGADARAFLDEPEQDVLGADVLVVESAGLPGWPGPSPCGHGR
jgi:hypothetical protein